MTVVASVVSKAAPGRLEELLEMTRYGAKIMERLGASNLRLLNGSCAVEAFGLLILSAEFPTGEAWGRYSDLAQSDEELQTLARRSQMRDSPGITLGVTTAAEIPTGLPAWTQAPIVEISVVRPAPGAEIQKAIEIGGQALGVFQRLGAQRCRLWQQAIAGAQTSTLVSTVEWANTAALGKALDNFADDKDGQAVISATQGLKPVVVTLSHDVFTQIPL
jgi:hypothetical protein